MLSGRLFGVCLFVCPAHLPGFRHSLGAWEGCLMPERNRNIQIAVLGQDRRQTAAAQALRAAGCRVGGGEAVPAADSILRQVPLPWDAAWAALLQKAKPGALLLGGRAPAEAAGLGRRWVNCYAREALAVRNAVPTAE